MNIRLASQLTIDSIVDGPGLRAVVWTQGCKHECRGCHNPHTHDMNGGFEINTNEIINQLKKLKLQKGITLSGGDPFEQSEAIMEIAEEAKNIGLDVWAYTGYTFEELTDRKNSNYFTNLMLLQNIDVLVDGRFIESKRDINLKFRGSSNQRIIDVAKTLKNKKVILHSQYIEQEQLDEAK